jgi:hypothetical protein
MLRTFRQRKALYGSGHHPSLRGDGVAYKATKSGSQHKQQDRCGEQRTAEERTAQAKFSDHKKATQDAEDALVQENRDALERYQGCGHSQQLAAEKKRDQNGKSESAPPE